MKTRLVCAHAGGQGKTTVAQTLYALSLDAGLEPKLAAADFKDETGSSKLGRLFPGLVRELGLMCPFQRQTTTSTQMSDIGTRSVLCS
jgi:hypothetical protein